MSLIAVADNRPAIAAASAAEKSERMLILALGAFVILQVWLGLIGSSLWLDETGTWWIVKDSLRDALQRPFSWSGQSLFYVIAWASTRVFGVNEVGLRLPSMLAMAGAVPFVYRIGERLCDRASATAAAFVFLCTTAFIAIDARQYAITLLCLTVSTWALLRWLDSNRWGYAVLHVIAGALAVYGQVILSLGLAPAIIYGYVRLRRDRRRLTHLAMMVAAIAACCLPLVPAFLHFYAGRSAHTSAAQPSAADLMRAFIPCSISGASVLLVWTALAVRGNAPVVRRDWTLLLVGVWAWFPPAFLALLSAGSSLHLFLARYYSSAVPGQALFIGVLLASIRIPAMRKALLVIIAAIAIFTQGRLAVDSHGNENWKAAMEFLRQEAGSSAPVLFVSGFVEANDFQSLRDPALREVLFAPEMMYGEPARSIHLPHGFTARDTEMEAVAKQLENEPRFYLLTENPDRSYENWLAGRLAAKCPSSPMQRSFGYIWVTRFICEKR